MAAYILPPCVLDAEECIVCTEVPPLPATGDRLDASAIIGWNGSANSVAAIGGDLHVVFTPLPNTVGLVLGFIASRVPNISPSFVRYGMYVFSAGGVNLVQVIEDGIRLTTALEIATDAELEIRRVASRISYFVNGVAIYASLQASSEELVVNACLFSTGDGVE